MVLRASKMEPKGIKSDQIEPNVHEKEVKGSQRVPEGRQKERKGSHMVLKGCQKGAKREPPPKFAPDFLIRIL